MVSTYSWIFMVLFLLLMVVMGWFGMKRTKTADDFATARSSYGPYVLGFAITATIASGSTFMGMPGLAYSIGAPSLWYPLLYPLATVMGMLLVARYIKKFGDKFGTRTIPEFMGERYNSDFLRLTLSVISILLIFYIISQFVAAATMFQTMMGLDYNIGLFLTGIVLAIYLFMGGSHSDIMTDAIQGALMIFISLVVVVVFILGYGVDGGFTGMLDLIKERRPEGSFDVLFRPGDATYGSAWLVILLFIAHVPFSVLPHIGNKFMAVKSNKDIKKLIMFCTIVSPLLCMMALGGMMGIAVIDPAQEIHPDQVIPVLFSELFPPIIAAFFAITVLSAILSTSDGLVVSITQIVANDIYRKTIVPRKNISPEVADKMELKISRYGTFVVLALAILLAWNPPASLSVFLWIGIGGIVSATAGPVCVGTLWKRATKTAAITSMLVGSICYWVVYLPIGFNFSNPFGAAGISVLVGMATMVIATLVTSKPAQQEVDRIFGDSETTSL
ncbi:sodium/solute symporter [Robertmurraya massiliosenegalensis]|uniref:sodium:solute symporter family protein n=1 Tax=Robertmurraya TaxID=2837507 RepID=UPI0039A7095D